MSHTTSKDIKAISESLHDFPSDAGGDSLDRAHSDHALAHIELLRTEPVNSYLTAAFEWGGMSIGNSISTREQSIGGILGRIRTVELEMLDDRAWNDAQPHDKRGHIKGKSRGEIGGEQQGDFTRAFTDLHLKCKDFDAYLSGHARGPRPKLGSALALLRKEVQEEHPTDF